jgi:phosphoesterase RecJ-like protein
MWNRIRDFIDRYDSFVVSSHINPDGDAIGSEMALAHFLRGSGNPCW